MTLDEAIKILEQHNNWRRDNDGIYEMADPKELGKAIDLVVCEFKNKHLKNVSNSACELCGGALVPKKEYDVHPYGDNIKYDECIKCGKRHNFKCF